MLSPEDSKKAIIKTFRKDYIADIEKLFNILGTNSRMSVFRRLKPLGYLTSYTDAGRYYTLRNIPVFDSLGLWFYKGVGFSKSGTLKSNNLLYQRSVAWMNKYFGHHRRPSTLTSKLV